MKAIKIALWITCSLVVLIRTASHRFPPYRRSMVDRIVSERMDNGVAHYVYLKDESEKPDGKAFASETVARSLKVNDSVSLLAKRDLFGVLHDSPLGGEHVIGLGHRLFDLAFVCSLGWMAIAVLRRMRARAT